MYVGFARGGMENGSAFQQQSDPVDLAERTVVSGWGDEGLAVLQSFWNGGNAETAKRKGPFSAFSRPWSEVAWRESRKAS